MKTVVQDLKDDLIKSIKTSEIALQEIEDAHVRKCCVDAVKITINTILKRIDEETFRPRKATDN
jgi:hypothetical protein